MTQSARIVFFYIALSLSLVCNRVIAQQPIKVYVERQLQVNDKKAIAEMIGFFQKSSSEKFAYDSVDKFSGSGIYITTAQLDYYKKAPADLKKLGEEGLYIQSSARHLYISANSSLGLQEAIFTYLDKLGFRFYFPDALWHIIPSNKSVLIPFSVTAKPDFANREMFMGFGYGNEKLMQKYLFWQRANRMGGAMEVNNEHAYWNLVADKKSEFQQHPEYLTKPLVDGRVQGGSVLNYSQTGLTDLTYNWLAGKFDSNKKSGGKPAVMLSLEPFDGDTYCKLPGCERLGKNSSDQVFYFTNEVAKKLKKTHPDKMIGILAYNDHIDIPKYKIEDNIFVTLTNGYNYSVYTTDELIARWKTRVKSMGIYDYLSVYVSTYDLPGKGLGGNYKRLGNLIKKYQASNIIAYKAESTYGWIGKGLAHYMVAQLTWNSKASVSGIADEFFARCFPQTQKWIKPVFNYWTNDYILTENELYQWFSALRNALSACNDPVELKRLHQLGLYLFYVKLWKTYVESPKEKVTQAGVELCAYLWKILEEGVVASAAALNSLPWTLGQEYDYFNEKAAWRTLPISYPKNKQEWLSFCQSYLPTLKHVEEGTRQYNGVPLLTKQELQEMPKALPPRFVNDFKTINFRGRLTFIVNTAASDSAFVKILSGRIRKNGKINLKVYSWSNTLRPVGKPLKEFSFLSDSLMHQISLKTLPRSKYVVEVTDQSLGGSIYFPEKLKYSVLASEFSPLEGGSNNTFVVYVPKGTKKFYVVKDHFIRLFDPVKAWGDYPTSDKFSVVPVETPGWWFAQLQLENMYFVGIPPLLSRNEKSFFFPE